MKNLPLLFILFLVAFAAYLGIQAYRGGGVLTFMHLPSIGAGSTLSQYIEIPKGGTSVINPKGAGYTEQPSQTAPQGFSASQLSPYYKKVSFGSVVRPSYANDARAFFSLYVDSSLVQPVDVTGWHVKGNGAYGITLPTAVADFEQVAIMYTQVFHGTDEILLRGGDFATFYSAASPMKGVSVRLNKCTGYLNQTYSFSPTLPEECPRAQSPRTVLFTGKCQNYLQTLYSCRTPSQDSINTSLDMNDTECRNFVSNLNYDGCHTAHRGEADFYSREWRVWMNQSMPFDVSHDRLVLYDKQGLVVNEYTY